MNTTPASHPALVSPLSPFQGFALGWSRYAEFQGRSSRVEFWSFHIINFFIGFVLSLFLIIPGVIYQVVVLIPSYAVWTRRLHDIGRSGWWIFWAFASFAAIILVIVGKNEGLMPGVINLFGDPVKPMTLAIVFVVAMNLIPTIMCFVDGNREANKYGPNPKLNPTNPNHPI